MTAPLITSLEQAGEGSRELDALIWAHFHPERVKVIKWNEPYGGSDKTQIRFKIPPGRRESVTNDRGPYPHATPVTTSLDAALALAERVLPGVVFWNLEHNAIINLVPIHRAEVSGERDGCAGEGEAATPALALCIAILRATHQETT